MSLLLQIILPTLCIPFYKWIFKLLAQFNFMERIRTKVNEIYIDQQGILHVTVLEGAFLDLEDMVATERVFETLTGNKPILALVDARAFHTLTNEAVKFMSANFRNKNRIATAILSEGAATQLIVNHMTMLDKTASPAKTFKEEEEAIAWLLTFKA
jgi:hypothetical protein